MLSRRGLIALIEEQGSIAEKQLINRWRPRIEGFLAAFNPGIQRGEQRLEIGLENDLVLKLVVKQGTLPPAEGLMRIAPDLPPALADLARLAVARGVKCHVGLRIQADACHRELYLYEMDGLIARALMAQGIPLPPAPPGMVITAYGIDELRGISAYFTHTHNPLVKTHLHVLGNKVSHELQIPLEEQRMGLWEHMRLRDGAWHPSKFGYEIHEPSVEVATRVLSHYRPPHFRYLVPFRAYHAIVMAGSGESGIGGWYFTLP